MASSEALSSLEGHSPILVQFLNEALAARLGSRTAPEVVEWMRGEQFGRFEVGLTRELCRQRLAGRTDDVNVMTEMDDSGWKLLCLGLSLGEQSR